MSGYMSIKRYTPDYLRVVHLRRHDTSHIQKPPVDDPVQEIPVCVETPVAPLSPTEEQQPSVRRKPRTSYARAKTAVFEYAICNEWQYFVTLTPDGKNEHYYNIDKFMEDVAHFVRNMRRKDGWEDLKYILVPEVFSKSGEGWHLHGFFRGIPEGGAVPFDPESAHSKKHRKKLQRLNDAGYLSFPEYSRRFGWATLSPIKDPRKAAGYISKYITKEFSARAEAFGCSLYYPCRGLNKAEEVFRGEVKCASCPIDTEFDYWNSMQTTFPFIAHNKYGSFGNCCSFDFDIQPDVGVIQLKVYTDEGMREVTAFDVMKFDKIAKDFVPLFSEADLWPTADQWTPFDDTPSILRSGHYEKTV